MKWIGLIVVAIIGYMIYSGNMGGARNATQNYVDVRAKGDFKNGEGEARPNIMHSLIKDNPFKNKD